MYDTVVIGQDVGSLVAAIASARESLKTAWVRQGDVPHCLTIEAYTFNVDPFPWTGFGANQMVGRLLGEWNLPSAIRSRIAPLNPALQVIHPRHRLEFFMEKEELIGDFAREFPEKRTEIGKVYQRALREHPFLEQLLSDFASSAPRSFRNAMKNRLVRKEAMVTREVPFSLGFSRAVPRHSTPRRLIGAMFSLLSDLQIGDAVPLVAARLLLSPMMGVYYFEGGKHGLLRGLEGRFESLGGDVLAGGDVPEVHPGKPVEVKLRQGGHETTIVAKRLIISAKDNAWRTLVSHEERFRGFRKTLEDPAGTLYPFTLHLGINENGIPERMSEYAVVLPDGEGLPQGRPVFLEMSAAGDRGLAPDGRRSLSATVLLDRPCTALEDGALENAARTILKQLEDFLPFLVENIDCMRVPESIAFCRRRAPVLNPKYRFQKMPDLGIFAGSGRTPLRNVFMTGGRMLPGLGFEGEVLSGIHAARLAAGGPGP